MGSKTTNSVVNKDTTEPVNAGKEKEAEVTKEVNTSIEFETTVSSQELDNRLVELRAKLEGKKEAYIMFKGKVSLNSVEMIEVLATKGHKIELCE